MAHHINNTNPYNGLDLYKGSHSQTCSNTDTYLRWEGFNLLIFFSCLSRLDSFLFDSLRFMPFTGIFARLLKNFLGGGLSGSSSELDNNVPFNEFIASVFSFSSADFSSLSSTRVTVARKENMVYISMKISIYHSIVIYVCDCSYRRVQNYRHS